MVTQADVDAGQVVNVGTGDSDETPPTTDPHTEVVPQVPSLSVAKALTSNDDEDGSFSVTLNDTLNYSVTVTNTGNVTLSNVVASDDLTATNTACATVAPGGTCVLLASYVVTQADVDAGQVVNVGTGDSDETPPTTDPHTEVVDALPDAVDDSASTVAETPVAGTVLSNDDLGDEPTTVTAFDVTSASGGTVTMDPAGNYTYTPAPGFNGTDTFDYTITDVDGDTDTATVTITVQAPPVADDDSSTTDEDTPVTTPVVSNDTDPDGTVDPTTVTIVAGPGNGTVTVNPTNGDVTYTPTPGFDGTDTYTYTVRDNDGLISNVATVTITVLQTGPPELSLTKAVDKTEAGQGDTLVYTLTYANTGEGDATGVTISDIVPEHTTFVSASDGGTLTAGTATWAIGDLAAGASESLTLIVQINATVPCPVDGGTGGTSSNKSEKDGPPADCTVSIDNSGTIVSSETPTPTSSNTVTTQVVVLTSGRMAGGGTVGGTSSSGGVQSVRHGFTLHCDLQQGPNRLEVNWGRGNKFHLEQMTSVRCSDDPGISPGPPVASFDTHRGAGTGRYNGRPATAEWVFKDAGQPGRLDTATIVVKNAGEISCSPHRVWSRMEIIRPTSPTWRARYDHGSRRSPAAA